MKFKAPGACPVCGREMAITRLSCGYCETKLEGEFAAGKFSRLSQEQLDFIEVFVKNRGNIKEVEKELGISYPTVRNRLDGVIQALGYRADNSPEPAEEDKTVPQDVLAALERGEITPKEAVKQLRKAGK